MIDTILLLIAGGTGGFIGGFFRARHTYRKRTPKVIVDGIPQPICTCKHPLSSHDPVTSACHDLMYVPPTQDKSSRHVKCPCKQYVGPKPAEEFFTTDIAWNASVMKPAPPITQTPDELG